jgi:hypothetical protein
MKFAHISQQGMKAMGGLTRMEHKVLYGLMECLSETTGDVRMSQAELSDAIGVHQQSYYRAMSSLSEKNIATTVGYGRVMVNPLMFFYGNVADFYAKKKEYDRCREFRQADLNNRRERNKGKKCPMEIEL